ncbi:hypothetical protein ACMAZF_05665 [Psychrobium sp. nBUS_13]|uniref:hypothetical protein n=1 Tax=Psychrobium sp. nBUS_13 TaxID=3395319 RepID=UPI003EB8D063
MNKRSEIIARKQKISDKSSAQWKELDRKHRDLSEAEGLLLTEIGVKKRYGDGAENVSPQWPDGSKNNNIDSMTVRDGNVLEWNESKGGNAGQNKRLHKNEYVEQGTPKYRASLLESMKAKLKALDDKDVAVDPNIRKAIKMLKEGNVKFNVYSKGVYDSVGNLISLNHSVYNVD